MLCDDDIHSGVALFNRRLKHTHTVASHGEMVFDTKSCLYKFATVNGHVHNIIMYYDISIIV